MTGRGSGSAFRGIGQRLDPLRVISVVALYLFIWGKVRSGQLSESSENYENPSVIGIPTKNGTESLRLRKDRIVTVRKTGTPATKRDESRAGSFSS